MTLASHIFAILSAVLVLVVVIEMLRRRLLRERHAVWWILAGLVALATGIFPSILQWAADLVGVSVPTNLVFFLSLAILTLVCLQHSAELTRLEAKARTLAESHALLEMRLRDLETKVQDDGADPAR